MNCILFLNLVRHCGDGWVRRIELNVRKLAQTPLYFVRAVSSEYGIENYLIAIRISKATSMVNFLHKLCTLVENPSYLQIKQASSPANTDRSTLMTTNNIRKNWMVATLPSKCNWESSLLVENCELGLHNQQLNLTSRISCNQSNRDAQQRFKKQRMPSVFAKVESAKLCLCHQEIFNKVRNCDYN